MILPKSLLQRMQRFVCADTFDGGDFGTVSLGSEEQTGAHRAAVEQHRASAAYAVFAPDVGSNQTEIMAYEINQRTARLNRRRAF